MDGEKEKVEKTKYRKHDNSAKTLMIQTENPLRYICTVFTEFPAENKEIKIFGKHDNLITIDGSVKDVTEERLRSTAHTVKAEAISFTCVQDDDSLTELMVVTNKDQNKILINYKGTMAIKEVIDIVNQHAKVLETSSKGDSKQNPQ